VMLAIRCFSSLYRGGIEGFEQQVWLNQYNILFNTLRFPGALGVIWLLGADLLVFFIYQLLLAVVEALVIKAKLHKFVSAAGAGIARFSILEIKRILPFAAGLAYTSGVWVLVSQLDKLLLSKYLSLQDYGYFSLVATISSGVLLLSTPVSRAIMPRMTLLLSQGKNSEMLELYRVATRFVVCIVAPVTLVLALFPSEIIVLWTGNADAADWVEPVLPLFVLGNGLLAVGAFQYYLQFAHGKIGLHVKYNTVSAAISVPLIIYAAANHGVIGVGYVWLGFRVLSLLIWTPYVHKVFAPGVHLKWLFFDVLPAVLVAAIGAALPYYLAKKIAAESSFLELILIVGTLIFSFGMAFLMTFRERLKGLIRERV
jgi:O-antigen/teichoic acid export membrane protein